MSTYTVSNATELKSALSKATGGDTIILADGSYGSLSFSDDFSSMVTIRAQNTGAAKFSGVELKGANYITFDGISTTSAKANNFSSNVGFVNSTATSGMHFRDVDGLIVDNNDITTNGDHALILNDIQNFVVSNNYIHDAGSDLMRITGDSHHGLIEDNFLNDVAADSPKHPDMIQVFGYDGNMPHDLRFTGNHLYDDPNTGSIHAQGIFLAGPIGDGYKNIQVDNNLINVGSPNSLFISGAQSNVVFENNTLIPWPSGYGAVIRISEKSGYSNAGLIVRDNVAKQLLDETGKSTIGNNYFYKGTDASQLFQGDGDNWQDFLPKSGAPFELGSGLGAEDRLNELLSGNTGGSDGGDNVSGGGNTPTEPDNSTGGGNQDGSGGETDIEYPTEPETTPGSGTIDDAALNLAGDHEFAGAADVIEIAPDAALTLDAGTIALSFNADSVSGKHGIITKDAYGYGDHFAAYIQNGTLKVRFQDGDSETFINVTGIKANTDYDLQVSFGDGDATVWLNGQKAGEVDTTMSWEGNGEYLQIGANGWASKSGEAGFGDLFDGTISDVLVVGGEYDPAGLDALANAAPEPEPEPEPETPTDGGNTGDNGDVDLPGLVFSLLGDNEFNGSRQNAFNQAHDAALELEEGTIAFSFNADKVSGKQGLISKDAYGYAGGGNHFTAWIHNGDLKIRFQDGEDDAEFVFENLKANTDYDVQAYFDGDTVGVLVDGKSIGEQAFDMDLTTNREYLQAGGMGWASETGDDEVNNGYDGTLTDVMIFDTAISQSTDLIAYTAISQAMDAIA